MYKVTILSIENLTSDVIQIRTKKPSGFKFIPGHSIMASTTKPGLESTKRPYNFTSTNDDPYLEFMIKLYPYSLTSNTIKSMQAGDTLVLSEMFGSTRYHGPGLFLAAGIGIAPFLAIFRQLKKDKQLQGNTLIYSNKTSKDIIHEKELRGMLGKNFLVTLTKEQHPSYHRERIDSSLLAPFLKQYKTHYIAGPWNFIQDMKKIIAETKEK